MKIRIIAVPPGPQHPFAVREKWLGVEMPVVPDAELAAHPPVKVDNDESNEGGYHVYLAHAVAALEQQGKSEVAVYWKTLPPTDYLLFKKECCQPIV